MRLKNTEENQIDIEKMHHTIRIEYQMLVYSEGNASENDIKSKFKKGQSYYNEE